MRVDVVLPVYNEERDLARSVLTLRRFLRDRLASYQCGILIADNASSDTTAEIGTILEDQFDNVRYLRLEERGRGRALRQAWLASAADIVCYMDVDLSTDLEALVPLVASLAEEGYDLVTGSRLIPGARVRRSLKRELLSRGYNVLLKRLLRVEFNDAQCGFKAMRRSLVPQLLNQVTDESWFFDSELLIKAQWMGLRIREIPVYWVEDPESRVKLWATSWNYIRSIARLRTERPAHHPARGGLIGWICSHPAASDALRNILAWGCGPIKSRVRQALERAPQERVLEVGCGSGAFSRLVSGHYLGIDTDRRFLAYAARRHGDSHREFAYQSATRLPYPDASFDQSLLINVMHHLADDELRRALGELSRVTRHQVIIVDMAPLRFNLFGMLCYRLDQGRHIRPLAAQRMRVVPYVEIRNSGYFRSGINLHSWFVGAPKSARPAAQAASDVPAPRSPLRILRLLTRLNIGGPSRHVELLCTQLDPRAFTTCLVTGRSDPTEGDLAKQLNARGVRVVQLPQLRRPVHLVRDLVSFLRILRLIWRERPHILHTHMAKAGTLGRLGGVFYNRLGPGRRADRRAALVHTFHGHVLDGYFSPWATRAFLAIERWLARRTDRLIAVSATVRDQLLAKGIGRPEQWQVIPLGLDLDALAQVPGHNGAPAQVGLVGRLVPIKNPRLFLEALRRLAAEQAAPPIGGLIVGDGPLRPDLEHEAHRLGLAERVRFTGWQHDLCAVYRQLAVACLTSWNEGTPVALIEAMAAGRAVVATDVGGVRDLLDDAGTPREPIDPGSFRLARRGVLVRSGDAEGLANALRTVVQDEALRGRLGEAGRAYVLQHLTHARLVQDVTAVYETLGTRGGTA